MSKWIWWSSRVYPLEGAVVEESQCNLKQSISCEVFCYFSLEEQGVLLLSLLPWKPWSGTKGRGVGGEVGVWGNKGGSNMKKVPFHWWDSVRSGWGTYLFFCFYAKKTSFNYVASNKLKSLSCRFPVIGACSVWSKRVPESRDIPPQSPKTRAGCTILQGTDAVFVIESV